MGETECPQYDLSKGRRMSEDPQRGTKLQEKNEMLKDSFGTEKEVY